MKHALLALACLALLPAPAALAHDRECLSLNGFCCAAPARIAPRHDLHAARIAITTRDGDGVMVLTDEVLAVQLSDHALRRVRQELWDRERAQDENPIAQAVVTAIFSGVRSLLDHSAECSIRDIREVEYRDGRLLVFTNRGRHRVFGSIDDDGDTDHLSRSFSESDARLFIGEFHRLKAERR